MVSHKEKVEHVIVREAYLSLGTRRSLRKLLQRWSELLPDYKKPPSLFTLKNWSRWFHWQIYAGEKDKQEFEISLATRHLRKADLPKQIRNDAERAKLTKPFRDWIFFRDDHTCQRCGVRLPASELECDHIVPLALDGETSPENLQTLCLKCHQIKTKEDLGKMSLPDSVITLDRFD